MLPHDYAEGQRVPVVVEVYPGASGADQFHRFGFASEVCLNAHLLASRGYAVLWPDIPLRAGNLMSQMADSVVSAVNSLIDRGIADPERVGVMGHSYGGYGVLALLTQTDIFRVAVASACKVNLLLYGVIQDNGESNVGWFESGQGRCGGSPWEKREVYVENSPFFYLDRVQPPLLVICGGADEADTVQAKQAFGALRRLDRRAELRIYRGERHWQGDWSEENLRDVCERILGWFDERLKPGA